MSALEDAPTFRPPRENLYRASMPGAEVRADGSTLFGHFAVFNQWTEINDMFEGSFMERIAPGAFRKTISDNADAMRVLFQHGRDPQVGDKPIASITALREDKTGAYYEADLLDSVPPLIVDGLRAGLYGASFRFRVMREDIVEEPDPSASNPRGLPERTIREARVQEFGPVTFGAYPAATSGVRSITSLIRDVDAVAGAAPILLDEERLYNAQCFIRSAYAEDDASEERATVVDAPDDGAAAPPGHDAASAEAEAPQGRTPRTTPATAARWWVNPSVDRSPRSWRR